MRSLPAPIHLCAGALLAITAVASWASATASAGTPGAAAPVRGQSPKGATNIILISVDTLRRDHLPFYGYPRDTAPQLARLAQSSLVFDNAIAAHSNTAPSHASILTGLYPHSHGVLSNRHHLKAEVSTLAQLLGRSGYQTAALVSGYTLLDKTTGLARGFESYDDKMGKPGELYAHQVYQRVKRFLQQRDPGRPLFYFLHLFDPHYPYVPPQPYRSRYEPPGAERVQSGVWQDLVPKRRRGMTKLERDTFAARYDAEIRFTDRYLGLIFKALEQHGLFDDSLIIFTADHGETLDDRPWYFDHGGRVYDEQIRIPLLLRLPGGAGGGQRVAIDAHHVDLAPTVLGAAGVQAPTALQGGSLLAGAGPAQRAPRPAFSMALSLPKRVPHLRPATVKKGFVASVRLPPYKLIAYPTADGHTFELFDLKADPRELRNILALQPEVAQRYQDDLARWNAALGAAADTAPQLLPPETEEMLKSLGYVE